MYLNDFLYILGLRGVIMSEYFNKMMIYLTPLIFIIMAVILGWNFKTYIHRRLKLFAKKTKWEGTMCFWERLNRRLFYGSFL